MDSIESVGLQLEQFGEFESWGGMTPQGLPFSVGRPILLIKIQDMNVKPAPATEDNGNFMIVELKRGRGEYILTYFKTASIKSHLSLFSLGRYSH